MAIYTMGSPGLINPNRRLSPQQDGMDIKPINQSKISLPPPPVNGTIIPISEDVVATFLLLYRNTMVRAMHRRGLFGLTVSIRVYCYYSKKQVGVVAGVEVEGSRPKLQAQSRK